MLVSAYGVERCGEPTSGCELLGKDFSFSVTIEDLGSQRKVAPPAEHTGGRVAARFATMKRQITKTKPKRNRIHVTLQILRSRYDVFALASKEIERRTGQAPGVEAMMEYDLEGTVDPDDLADLYCWSVLKWSRDKINTFSNHHTGRARVRKRRDGKTAG